MASASNSASAGFAPVYWLAVGTFAVGTEGFMIAAILPRIAADLAVSIQAAGQLVTVFALTYALSSPVLTALTGGINRRMTLLAAMAAFVVANIVAAAATGYWSLFVARILIAIAAGIYVPGASALAAALVPPERRGRALAIVTGGISLAVALGVPVGALIGTHFGWRTTFLAVGALASAALVGLLIGLPREAGGGLTTATLQERIAVATQPAALRVLMVTTLWAMGGYTVYTFIAPYLAAETGVEGGAIGGVLFLWGGAAFAGLLASGFLTDRLGARRVTVVVLPTMALALLSLSASAHFLAVSQAMLPVLVAVIVWGATGWGFFPAQQSRLIGIVGLARASVILSLNASFMYLGFSLGAVLGSLTLTRGGVADLGMVGATCVLAAYVLFLATDRRASACALARRT
jgi:predicted MFS family arabinose efflux permease